MSTRCTIGYGEGYHLYEECFDQDKVWLELEGKVSEIEYSSIRDGCLVVGIDVTAWREIVKAWVESHWANNPDRDHKQPELNLSGFEELISKLKTNKENNNGE